MLTVRNARPEPSFSLQIWIRANFKLLAALGFWAVLLLLIAAQQGDPPIETLGAIFGVSP